MKTLTTYRKFFNKPHRQFCRNHQAQKHRHRSKRPRQMVFDASIEVSRCGDCRCAAVAIFYKRRKIDHKLLMLRDSTEERCWYQAYQIAQQLADKHSEGARIFICKEVNKIKAMRRAA